MNNQDFHKYVSKLFLNVDISNQRDAIISSYLSRPDIILLKEPNWISYPPMDDNGNEIPYVRFAFKKHPVIEKDITDGIIMILLSKDQKGVLGMTITFSFATKTDFDTAYRSIKKSFKKYSSTTNKRQVALPFEVIKYWAKEKDDFIIMTRGEGTNGEPYLHMAYNYQGYKW